MVRQQFCPEDDFIFPQLRARIESWQDHLPSSQFQQYGPLDKYFNLVFNRYDHLVKPQALFRVPVDELDSDLLQDFPDQDDDVPDDSDLLATLEDLHFHVERGDISIDSTHAGHVWRTQAGKAYPDFAICKYVADAHAGDERDRVLIVVEVASVPRKARKAAKAKAEECGADNSDNEETETDGDTDEETDEDNEDENDEDDADGDDDDDDDDDDDEDEEDEDNEGDDGENGEEDSDNGEEDGDKDDVEAGGEAALNALNKAKEKVMNQLLSYMIKLGAEGDRWEGSAIGIGIIGTEVAFFQRGNDPNWPWVHFSIMDPAGGEDVQWFSLYGPEFRDFIMTMQALP